MSGRTQPDSSTSGRSSGDASPTSPRSVLGKMILPRLGGSFYEPSSLPKRTAHACERCRALKAKCTGGQRCEKCVIDKADCKYGDGKRERNKKEMASQLERTSSLANQNEQLLAAIREVSTDTNFNPKQHPAVMELLSKYPAKDSLVKTSGRPRQERHHARARSNGGDDDDDDEETVTFARIGSPGAMDRVAPLASLGIGSGASGYIGKSSEISWLQRALEHMSLQEGEFDHVLTELEENHPRGSPLDYHMDEADLLAVDEESVDPMELPPLPIATVLAESYFETVHGSFPLIDKDVFMDTLVHRFHSRPPLSWEGRRWLSVANIIFAIGAKWMYLTRPFGAAIGVPNVSPGDHIVYYARARSLGLDHRLIMDHPLLEQIQALGVLGLYLIVNHQISRAWTTIGHAIRHAIALGLHLRVGAGIGIGQQHHHSRTWWSLYSLEQLLGDFTGRPTSILDNDIAIPLQITRDSKAASQPQQKPPTGSGVQQVPLDQPHPVLKDLPYSPHLYFACRVRLSIIGHKIRSSLYSSTSPHRAWSKLQQSVREFDRELTQWSADIPAAMDVPQGIDLRSSDRCGGELLNRYELAMSYQSIRMILFRPCLYPLTGMIRHDSAPSQNFNQEAAVSCISAARNLMALLPDDAATFHASKMLPCWSLLHYINQAGAVLMLELSLKAEHVPTQVEQLLRDMEKVVEWLAVMAADSLSAWRSWTIFRKLSLQAAAVVGIDISVPEDVQKPPGWKPAYEQLFSQTLNVPVDSLPNLQTLDRVHQQQAGMAPGAASDILFPIAAEMGGESWHLSPNMTHSTANLTYSERPVYPPSTGDSEGEMDWRA